MADERTSLGLLVCPSELEFKSRLRALLLAKVSATNVKSYALDSLVVLPDHEGVRRSLSSCVFDQKSREPAFFGVGIGSIAWNGDYRKQSWSGHARVRTGCIYECLGKKTDDIQVLGNADGQVT